MKEQTMKLDEKDIIAAIDAYEKEVGFALSDASGKEIGNMPTLLGDESWRKVTDDNESLRNETFSYGFLFGIFVARSILIAASEAIKE